MSPTPQWGRGRYRGIELLGMGGMGAVWRAFDRLNQTEVAIKQVRKEIAGETPRLALAREFQTLSTLRHPHIISVLDYGFDHGMPFLAMPLLRGSEALTAEALRRAHVTVEDALCQILLALIYLHRRGVVHCDLKPSNALIEADGRVRLIDFGIASEAHTASPGTLTMRYLAPELMSGGRVSPASDLYSVGVLAYELLVGRHPFEGTEGFALIPRILYEEPDLAPLPEAWVGLVSGLLAKDPKTRFGSAYDAVLALSAALAIPPPAETADVRESFLQAARFVGRQAELEVLHHRLDCARQGRGGVLLIGGESGVGKSRLVDELRTAALSAGLRVTRGQAVLDGGLIHQIWRDALPPLLLDAPVPPETAALLRTVVPHIDALTGHALGRAEPVDAAKFFPSALAALLDKLHEPTLIVLEDLQWAVDSVEILRDLVPRLAQRPVLIVATYRSDEVTDLPADLPGADVIALGRLPDPALMDLSQAILGPTGLTTDLLDTLARQTEGNAFFVVEILRALAEDAGRLDEVRHAPTAPIMTGGMRHVMGRRLRRAPAWARPLLNDAAVAGRSLDLDVIADLAGSAVDVDRWLAACADAALLDVVDDGWRFAHDKIREALIDDLDAAELAAVHRRVARATEAVHGSDPAYAGVVARHWAGAGDLEKASQVAQRSDSYHRRTSAHKAAQHMLRAVLAHMDDSRDARHSVPLYLALGERHVELGEFEDARRAYEHGLDVATRHGITQGLARGPLGLAYIAWRTLGVDAAYARFEYVLALADADVLSRVRALNFMGGYYTSILDLARAESFYREAEQLCIDTENAEGLLLTRGNLSYFYLMSGDFEAGIRAAQAASTLAVQEGNGLAEASARVNLALGQCYIDDLDGAERTLDAFDTVIERIRDKFLGAYGLRTRGILAERRGDHAQAQTLYQRAIDAFDAMGAATERDSTRFEMVHVLCASGAIEAARPHVSALVDCARASGHADGQSDAVIAAALFAASLGRTDYARAWLATGANTQQYGGQYVKWVREAIEDVIARDNSAAERRIELPDGDVLDAIHAALEKGFTQ